MFVQYLNGRQQRALLHYAREMVRVGGTVAGGELLAWLTEQARPDVEAEEVPLKDLTGLFCTPLTRVAFLLDVVLIGYVDPDFNPTENKLTHDLTKALGLDDNHYLKFHYIDQLRRVFNGKTNDYTLFGEIENRHGVYAFKDMEGNILYVGKASKQDVKTRIAQYFRNDSGGTFRKNLCKYEDLSFPEYRERLCTYRVVVVSTTMENAMWISSFERDLIARFNPKYNKT